MRSVVTKKTTMNTEDKTSNIFVLVSGTILNKKSNIGRVETINNSTITKTLYLERFSFIKFILRKLDNFSLVAPFAIHNLRPLRSV